MLDHDLDANPLYRYFSDNPGRLIHKWMHYFPVYHHHFQRFRGSAMRFLEFGVYHGGSLQMWKHYFGDRATIIGVDIDPRCQTLEEDRVHVRIGDQADRAFLRELVGEFGPFDVVLDDGGHQMHQQIATFEELYPAVSPTGVFVVEDLLTSYRPSYQGGCGRPGTFIEYSKTLIDRLHAWHSQEDNFVVDDFTRSAHGLHYYDSMLVVEKRPREKPRSLKQGTPSFPL